MNNILEESDMAGIFASVTEISKAKPYRIDTSFAHRFRVWKTQILPGRMNSIRQEHSVEFVHRMMDLLIADADRLTNRAIREFEHRPDLVNIVEDIDVVMKDEISAYITEIDNIKLEGVN